MLRPSRTMRHGFTLIELMIVIAIIGLLMSFAMTSIRSSRMRSRDVKRITDMRTIQSALEQHALVYPTQPYPPLAEGYCGSGVGIYGNPCFSDFIGTTPVDPDGQPYTYVKPACLYRTAGAGAKITMIKVDNKAACDSYSTPAFPSVYNVSYGLHVELERDNEEAKNDRSPTDARSYDLMP